MSEKYDAIIIGTGQSGSSTPVNQTKLFNGQAGRRDHVAVNSTSD